MKLFSRVLINIFFITVYVLIVPNYIFSNFFHWNLNKFFLNFILIFWYWNRNFNNFFNWNFYYLFNWNFNNFFYRFFFKSFNYFLFFNYSFNRNIYIYIIWFVNNPFVFYWFFFNNFNDFWLSNFMNWRFRNVFFKIIFLFRNYSFISLIDFLWYYTRFFLCNAFYTCSSNMFFYNPWFKQLIFLLLIFWNKIFLQIKRIFKKRTWMSIMFDLVMIWIRYF